VVVELAPSLCTDTVETLRDHLYDLLREPGRHVVLDGSELEDISAAGVGVLIAAGLVAQQTGATLQIANPSPVLRRTLVRHQHVAKILNTAS
jgi:anti-anti-sigma regulatory factor